MAAASKRSKRGKYCVCGGPGAISCTNTYHVEGISMHKFPKDEEQQKLWEKFVRRHRPDFVSTSSSVICSAHFDESCFAKRYSVGVPTEVKPRSRYLIPGSIPTKDSTHMLEEKATTSREKRKVLRDLKRPDQDLTKLEQSSSGETSAERDDEGNEDVDISDDEDTAAPVLRSQETQTTLPCANYDEKKGKVQNLQNICSKQRQRLRLRNRRILDLVKENKQLKKTIELMQEESLPDEDGSDSNMSEISDKESDDIDAISIKYQAWENEPSVDSEEEEEEEEAVTEVMRDPNWTANMEEESWTSDVDEVEEEESQDKASQRDVQFEEGTPPDKEAKFVVFCSMLVSLFSLFCFNCKGASPSVKVKAHGTMATVEQKCTACKKGYKWSSQPLVLGKYPAGNILLSFATLMSGSSISKVLLLFRHMGLKIYSARTFFHHQREFIFPVILKTWEASRNSLIGQLEGVRDVTWAGDGRFDSMGHSAKYGSYTMLNCNLLKIVHFELIQVMYLTKV